MVKKVTNEDIVMLLNEGVVKEQIPVSYTHLDVYKRQNLIPPETGQNASALK